MLTKQNSSKSVNSSIQVKMELERLKRCTLIDGKLVCDDIESIISKISYVTWIGLIINSLLCISKIFCGILGNSRTILADGINSFLDSVSGVLILVGVRFWVEPADSTHPYGHQRLESLVTLFIGLTLFLAGFGIIYDAISGIGKDLETNDLTVLGLIILIISLIIKELLFRWTFFKSKQLQSSALEASAFDHRSDALATVPLIIAVGMSLWYPKYSFLDVFGAFWVSGIIFYSGFKIIIPAINILIDRGASKKVNDLIIKHVNQINGVKGVHDLRTRFMGQRLIADLSILVEPNLTVDEAHNISIKVEEQLLSDSASKEFGVTISDVLVKFEPESY